VQWCELKAKVSASSPEANTELVKDLASLTMDGARTTHGREQSFGKVVVHSTIPGASWD
jgi:hypothetical protein